MKALTAAIPSKGFKVPGYPQADSGIKHAWKETFAGIKHLWGGMNVAVSNF
jgi:hypothetical protein